MLTLDEVMTKIVDNKDVAMQNLLDCKDDLENEKLFEIFMLSATQLMAEVLESRGPITAISKICAQSHVMYALGKTVGMMMERDEEIKL